MHLAIYLQLHELRAAERERAARTHRMPRRDLRTQLGWTLVELGLHLVRQPAARVARMA